MYVQLWSGGALCCTKPMVFISNLGGRQGRICLPHFRSSDIFNSYSVWYP